MLLRKPELRQAVSKYVVPVVEAYGKQLECAMALEQRGLIGLSEVMLAGPTVPTNKQQVAIVLARQDEPLLAREIQEKMLKSFPLEVVPTVGQVRAVLSEGSEFVQYERYRWQFGRRAGPWRE